MLAGARARVMRRRPLIGRRLPQINPRPTGGSRLSDRDNACLGHGEGGEVVA